MGNFFDELFKAGIGFTDAAGNALGSAITNKKPTTASQVSTGLPPPVPSSDDPETQKKLDEAANAQKTTNQPTQPPSVLATIAQGNSSLLNPQPAVSARKTLMGY